ncbi:NAD-dependent epimerase/dehydratase family protein [Gemmatimonas groenlandica]|uniref:NAD(P)-dependent oxidoreductase n=1 Tax=Gemmatimonas groenlandica TaxID=2732249 RepID=A0A6M4INW1_9BACT|nr:NAD-dependent epimerase/dehydratase family protein [Gemmatimonas groenlandica]QJR36413.1 NAD(P)-dependent oxidoreductase [Gemmatimonas groenlandica]
MTNGAPTTELELDALLSAPDDHTVAALSSLSGDVLILGAGGKMGPTVARMARRAIADQSRRVIAVSRFTDASTGTALQAQHVETIRADLADPAAVAALPDAPNVLWMAGQKFGSTGDPVGTWTQNVVASTIAAQRYAGSRIVCFSTGNVYGRQAVAAGGAREGDALLPDGEYAASCIGRERVFESIARRTHSPLLLYRLFYACDLRYGVVTDIAHKVLNGTPVSLDTAFVNVIWQGDANRLALRALTQAAAPADGASVALNVTGPVIAVRDIAERVGTIAGVAPVFAGTPSEDALIANIEQLNSRLPYTALPLDTLCDWAVRWIRAGGRLLNKPTKFEVRDGRY